MTQNTLSDEIERIVDELINYKYAISHRDHPIEQWRDKLRNSLRSIAEKTVEAVRVEPIETAERITVEYANITGRDETMRVFVREAAIKVLTEQSKLASHWLGKEKV